MRRGAFFLILLLVLTFVTFKFSHAFFVSSAVSQNNTFTTAAEFSISTGSATIVINEVNPNGGNDDDWIEVFNKTGAPIDISGWKVSDNNSTETIPNGTIIPGNGYGVIVASGSATSVPVTAIKIELTTTAIGNGLAPGGERILLEQADGTDIDAMSYGSVATPFILPPITSTPIYARNPNGQDTDLATDWVLQAPTIGVSNN